MSNYINKYVGGKYIPTISGEWDINSEYESLSIVQVNGDGYTSKKNVPIGVDITNELFWVKTGNYNSNITRLDETIIDVNSQIEALNINKLDINATSIGVNQIDKNKGKLDQTFMTEEFLQQMAGTTPLNSIPAEGSVSPKQTTFVNKVATSTNIADVSEYVEGYYISSVNGTLTVSASYHSTGFIDVSEFDYVMRTQNEQMAFYDVDKVFVSGSAVSATTPIARPVNAKYARFSINNVGLSTFSVNSGQTLKAFTPYTYKNMLQNTSSDTIETNNTNILTNTNKITDLNIVANIKKVENIVVNGNFVSGLTYPWAIYYSSSVITDGSIIATGDGSNTQILVRQNTSKVQANTVRKLYIGFDFKTSDLTPSNINVRLFGITTAGTIVQKSVGVSTNVKRYSNILTTAGNGSGDLMFEICTIYANATLQNGKSVTIDNVVIIDITDFEFVPNVSMMEKYLSKYSGNFFDGTGVLTSVLDDVNILKSNSTGEIIVSKNGAYPTINSAITKINELGVKTTIIVMPGEYEEVVKPIASSLVSLQFKDKYSTKLIDKSGLYANTPLYVHGDFYGKDLHVVANHDSNAGYVSPYAYGYHHEGDGAGTVVFENCKFESFVNSAVGIGMRQDQTLIFRNCEFYNDTNYNGGSFYCHNAQASNVTNQHIIVENCKIISKQGLALRIDDSNIGSGNGDHTSIMDILFINNTFYSEATGLNCYDMHQTPLGAGKLSGNIELHPMSHGNNLAILNAY